MSSLHAYRRPRLVVLNADSPVLEAARAMEHNEIGAVFVQAGGRTVGIVTDRDLAVRALGRGLDSNSTPLSDVMTPTLIALTPNDSHADAIRIMRDRHVRRIALMDGERLVGVVTLDDLLLDQAAPPDELAAIVEAQLGDGGPADSDRGPGRRRALARSEATLARLVDRVREDAGLDGPEPARTALDIVLSALVRRLTPDEATDFIAQLPSLVQPTLRALPLGPDKLVTRESIEEELTTRLGVEAKRAGQVLVATVGTISRTVSAGEMEEVRDQLPKDLQEFIPELAH